MRLHKFWCIQLYIANGFYIIRYITFYLQANGVLLLVCISLMICNKFIFKKLLVFMTFYVEFNGHAQGSCYRLNFYWLIAQAVLPPDNEAKLWLI